MADTRKRFTDYPEETEIQDDDYVMIDNGKPQGTRKFLASGLGGSGGAYEETTLWSGSEYQTNTQLNLSGNISDYDQINFQVYRKANNYNDQQISQIHLASALSVGETIAVLGYGGGDYLYMTISADNKIVIAAGYGISFTIRKIVGIKY